MIAEKIEMLLKGDGIIPADIVEELHQLVKESDKQKCICSFPTWQYRVTGLAAAHNDGEIRVCEIRESTFEEMYRCYISAEKAPALTFSQYQAAVGKITGIRAA